MNAKEAKAIPLETILGKYGYTPAYRRGADLWYGSPFRAEETPSFVVNTHKNVWYDHGEGKGGNVIDLVSRLSDEASIARILAIVAEMAGGIVRESPREVLVSRSRAGENPTISASSVTETDLSHPALVKYLEGRAIPAEFARRYVREVRYETGGKQYFGIGFRNESGGYEVRNPYFKGCVGSKDISVIPGMAPGIVNLFEGFTDFLSWPLLSGEEAQETALVLNSVSLVNRAVAYLEANPAEEIRLFLDRDDAGRAAEKRLREALPACRIVDMSERYQESEDVNRELVRLRDRKAELERAVKKGK